MIINVDCPLEKPTAHERYKYLESAFGEIGIGHGRIFSRRDLGRVKTERGIVWRDQIALGVVGGMDHWRMGPNGIPHLL